MLSPRADFDWWVRHIAYLRSEARQRPETAMRRPPRFTGKGRPSHKTTPTNCCES